MAPIQSTAGKLVTKSQPNLQPGMDHGMLTFKSWKDFASTVKYLNEKGTQFILDWNTRISFRSQGAIFEEIIEQENSKQEAQAALLDPNISLEEMKKIKVGHSEIYKQYLDKGMITEVAENDGTTSFSHNVLNPTFMCVVNEEGFVEIGDTIYQYLPNKIKYISDGDFSKVAKLKELNSTSAKDNIYVINYHKMFKSGGGDWSNSTEWLENGSTKRMKADVVAICPDLGNGADAAFVTYYFEVIAEGWLFGWSTRNNYHPIDWTDIDLEWSEYYYPVEEPLNIYSWDFTESYYKTDYPMDGGTTNHCLYYLDPNGWVGMTGFKFFSFYTHYDFSLFASVYGTISLSSN